MSSFDRLASWESCWTEDHTPWHLDEVNPDLAANFGRILGGDKPDGKVWFVPLCGKSLDMVWLLGRGCSVVGAEGSVLAAEAFFTENNIEYTTEGVPNGIKGKVLKSKNGRMVMYVCDLFDLTEDIIGPVDFVLDRGSLEAVYEADREAYLGLMKATKPTSYLLTGFEYGPKTILKEYVPFPITKEFVDEVFGTWGSVELVDSYDCTEYVHGKGLDGVVDTARRNVFLVKRRVKE